MSRVFLFVDNSNIFISAKDERFVVKVVKVEQQRTKSGCNSINYLNSRLPIGL